MDFFNKWTLKRSLSPAERIGLAAFCAAAVLSIADLRLATVPLTLFVILCAAAPFFPGAGLFFPVVSRGRTGRRVVALTVDDGPDPLTTPHLLDLLDRYRASATFFVTGRRAARYPDLIRLILAHGHSLGNHTDTHDCFRIFWQPARMAREIDRAQAVLSRLGAAPLVFRPPVGIVTPMMARILDGRGLTLVTFSCRALDWGNRRVKGLAGRILRTVAADDIVLLHDTPGGDAAHIDAWLREVHSTLDGLQRRGLAVVPLERLIGRPVMRLMR